MKPWEPAAVFVMELALLVVPLVVKELYPFSLCTMFSVAPRQVARYTITDADGRHIEPERVSLHIISWHDPPVRTLGRSNGYGRLRKASAHIFGEIASAEVVETAVRQAWRTDATLPDPLVVRQEVFAWGTQGTIECIADRSWRWSRQPSDIP